VPRQSRFRKHQIESCAEGDPVCAAEGQFATFHSTLQEPHDQRRSNRLRLLVRQTGDNSPI
jgi:hypothetical protein